MAEKLQRRHERNRGEAYRHRGSARQRGYSTAYDKAREHAIAEHPLCQVCEAKGVIRPTEETHHVIPVQQDRTRAADIGNLLCVCRSCHDEVEGMGWAELARRYGIGQETGG